MARIVYLPRCCASITSESVRVTTYSTIGFIESLTPQKHLWRTDLIDSPTGVRYGWFIEFGPITIIKITGWHGERVTVFKFFKHEFLW
jgi:hypothetical protein